MPPIKRLLITPGEPAGIGPDITLRIAQQNWPVELLVVASPALLKERAAQLNLPIALIESDLDQAPSAHVAGQLKVLPVMLNAPVKAGTLAIENSAYVMQTLKIAAFAALEKRAHALVTGPVHKGILNQAGIVFSGHTEFLAQCAGVEQTVMLFVVNQLRVALVTTHIPLKAVPAAITPARLKAILSILKHALQRQFNITAPRILVCGLNPHAGEGGYLGREEIEVITPVLDELRQQQYLLQGPLPADTLFTPHYLQQADAILAMYHDQALPVVKHIGFSHAVNVTLGLPFIRTSVDHGTALDIAGTNKVDIGSMEAAMTLATQLESPI